VPELISRIGWCGVAVYKFAEKVTSKAVLCAVVGSPLCAYPAKLFILNSPDRRIQARVLRLAISSMPRLQRRRNYRCG